MPRTRRPRTRGKPRNIHSNSPAASSTAAATPPPSRRSAPAQAATAGKASGRTTQNSRGNRGRSRGPGSARKNNIGGRNGSNRGGRGRIPKKDNGGQDPSCYKDIDGEVYKRGGVYIG